MEKRLLAVSDIHGCCEEFRDLLDLANYNSKYDQLVLLGDYVDRGPNSFEVVELVMELVSNGAVALMGNHEQMFLNWYEGDWDQLSYFMNGGDTTYRSYKHRYDKNLKKHLEFLKDLPLIWEDSEYCFVHAGLNPQKNINQQLPNELLWIRDEWLYSTDSPTEKTVVFGHSIVSHWLDCTDVYVGNNRLGINTGAGCGGYLSLVDLSQGIVYSEEKIALLYDDLSRDIKNFNMTNIEGRV